MRKQLTLHVHLPASHAAACSSMLPPIRHIQLILGLSALAACKPRQMACTVTMLREWNTQAVTKPCHVCAKTAHGRRWLDTRSAASEGTSLGALALPWTFAGQLTAAVGVARLGKGAARSD